MDDPSPLFPLVAATSQRLRHPHSPHCHRSRQREDIETMSMDSDRGHCHRRRHCRRRNRSVETVP